jgi:hypothetical protein
MHFMTRMSYTDGEVVDLYATEGGTTADGVQRVVVQPGLMERLRRQSHNSAVWPAHESNDASGVMDMT